MNKNYNIIIREAYKNYEPAFDVVATVNRLLDGIPQKHLAGLKTIVLSCSTNLSKKARNANVRQNGISFKAGDGRGRYHQKWNDQEAWIELLTDNVLRGFPRPMLAFSLFRDLAISDVLFHEIGHHIHCTQEPDYKEKEDVAATWERHLHQHYYRRQYWYLTPLFFLLWLIFKPFRVLKKRKQN